MPTRVRGAARRQGLDPYCAHSKLFSRGSTGPQTEWPSLIKGDEVSVDVFITPYGESVDVIRRTLVAALEMHGLHHTWVLDDGRSDEVRDLASDLGARYVRRLSGGGAKAGNVNHALTLAKGELFAIFDADFVPDPSFLVETVAFFIDDNVAFVQTPQAFANLRTTVARGRATCRPSSAGSSSRAAIASMRRSAWGRMCSFGDPPSTTSAVGEAPESIEAYSKRQLRWATGGFEIMMTHNPLSPKRNLTTDRRIQYFVTGTFYLTGIAPLILLLVPSLEIYFDLRPMTVSISVLTWFLYYAHFSVMQILLAWYTLGSFRWETLTLATVSFPIYVKALFNFLPGRDVGWQATGAAKNSSPFNFVVPQMLFFLFLAPTSVVAVYRDITNGVATLAMAWNVTNTVILGAFLFSVARDARLIRRGDTARRDADESPSEPLRRTIVARPARSAQPERPTILVQGAPVYPSAPRKEFVS